MSAARDRSGHMDATNEENDRAIQQGMVAQLGLMGLALWETDAAGVVITDSPSWRANTGQTLEQWLGYGLLNAVHPDDREYAEQQWREAVAAGRNVDAEFRLRSSDGGWRWTNLRAAPLRDTEGTITKWIGMNLDITKRKQAEEELTSVKDKPATELADMERLYLLSTRLLQQDELTSVLHEVLTASIELLHADKGNVQLYDERKRVLEIVASVGFNQDFLDHFKTVDANDNCVCRFALKRRERVVAENLPIDPDFKEFAPIAAQYDFQAVQSTPLLGSNRRVFGILSTHWVQPHHPSERELRLLDLYAQQAAGQIERKRAEEALRRREEWLRKIVDTNAVGVLFFDQQTGTLMDANDAFLRITGYTRRQVDGRKLTWRKMTPPEYVDESLRQLEQLEVTGRIGPYEKEYYCKDGSRRWMLFSGASLEDGTIVEFCVDMTDRKRAEEALRDADRRKDEFLTMLSHELRNPLAPIANALQLLHLGQGDTSIQQEALGALERQVATITRLVDDLLDVSRVTTGRIQLQQTDVDLNALVWGAADSFRPQMTERKQEFSVSLSGSPLWVHGDPIRLEQVVVNLLSNALKYTPEGGRVWLTVVEEGGDAVIRVRDSGNGIEAALLPHIFELFSQGERGLDRRQGGLGIGLPLVKSLVEMHDGTVTAQSEGSGRGSEFVVHLPAVPSPVPQTVTPPEDSAGPAARSLRVLLVDDVPDTRIVFGRLLEILGHQVRTAGDGPSALEAALEFRPDVVLLDLGLPGMNGYEVTKRMRQQPALQNAVLAAVTGYGQQIDRQRTEEAGFDHHLVKPIDVDALQQLLAAIAESRTR
jgi:PAS domain S-box-containing protein